MKINFYSELKSIDGSVLQRRKGDDVAPMLLKDAAIEALMQEFPNENADGNAKLRRALLAERIFTSEGAVDVTAEDAALLKERIGRGYGAVVVFASYKLLDG